MGGKKSNKIKIKVMIKVKKIKNKRLKRCEGGKKNAKTIREKIMIVIANVVCCLNAILHLNPLERRTMMRTPKRKKKNNNKRKKNFG